MSGLFEELLTKRVVLVTGKGGVGRTTLSAALAQAAVAEGKRTALCDIGDSEGATSPLAALFSRERFSYRGESLRAEVSPKQAGDHPGELTGIQLWPAHGQELFLRDVLPGGALVAAALKSKALQGFMRAAPSLVEMGIFNHLLSLLKATRSDNSNRYDLVIVDMPATGHTMALTALPEILLELVQRGPIPRLLREGQAYLNNPKTCAACIVALPEILPVSEALDLAAGLEKSRVPVGGIILNRVPADSFSESDHKILNSTFAENAIFGSLDYSRIARSEEAQQRLRQEGMNVQLTPDFIASATELVDQLKESLLDSLGDLSSASQSAEVKHD